MALPFQLQEVFSNCQNGVNAAYDASLIGQEQLAWQVNGTVRGGKSGVRPAIKEVLTLPTGKVQGVGYFGAQNGMIVVQIDGRLYRLRVNDNTFAYEEITLDFINSPSRPRAWMQETSGYLIIQDGESNPIIYDGSTARRSDVTGLVNRVNETDPIVPEVPLGRMMAYVNGRLWVAINDNELVAGDIKTNADASELKFTENQYFTGGGAFYFPFKINAIAGIPATGAAGYGALLVCGDNRTQVVRADVSSRDLWNTMPGFIQDILLNTGCVSDYAMAEVNQDLYWRDSQGQIRSIKTSAYSDSSQSGLTPVSREVSRVIDHESHKHLGSASSIFFGNRLITTASPFIDSSGSISFRKLIALDMSPISSMSSSAPPAFDGEWTGLSFNRLVKGFFKGSERAFAISTDTDGNNRLWEISKTYENDRSFTYVGTSASYVTSSIERIIEYPRRNFGDTLGNKRLERCDVYLSNVKGEVGIELFWRKNNDVKWYAWDEASVCAKTTDATTTTPHVWKNLAYQGRDQIRSFTIPNNIIEDGSATHVGFDFQIKLKLTGLANVFKCILWASKADDHQFAELESTECLEYDITGNASQYVVPIIFPKFQITVSHDSTTDYTSDERLPTIDLGSGTIIVSQVYSVENTGEIPVTISSITLDGKAMGLTDAPSNVILSPGASTTFTIICYCVAIADFTGRLTINATDGFLSYSVPALVTVTLAGPIISLDNFNDYADGNIAIDGGYNWLIDATANRAGVLLPMDNFDEYPDGVVTQNLGSDWLAAGTII